MGEIAVRLLDLAHVNDGRLVDDEDFVERDADGFVGDGIADSVAEAGVERMAQGFREDVADFLQAVRFEDVRAFEDLLGERGEEFFGRREDRPVRQPLAVLYDRLEEVSRRARLTQRARGEVEELVLVLGDVRVERAEAGVGPVPAEDGGQVAHDVRLGDGAVDVGDDHLGGVGPEEDARLDLDRAGERRGVHDELDDVGAVVEAELDEFVVAGSCRCVNVMRMIIVIAVGGGIIC